MDGIALSVVLLTDIPQWVDSCRSRIPNQILHKRNSTCSERRGGFRITIFDDRTRGDNLKPRLERVVVAGQ
jgi:hypothetical protein